MNRHVSLLLVCAAVLLTSWRSAAVGQESEAGAPIPTLEEGIAELNATMKQIADLLARQVEGQQLALVIQRVDLATARMAQTEQELSSARSSRSSLEDEKSGLEARLAQVVAQLDSGTMDAPAEEIEQFSEEMDLRLKLIATRIRRIDQKIVELENVLSDHQRDVRGWQDFVDRKLGDL